MFEKLIYEELTFKIFIWSYEILAQFEKWKDFII